MDELKWKLFSNSMDFVSRYKLTKKQLKDNLGLFAVWRGALPKGQQSVLTQISYEISKTAEITETAHILAILDLKDLNKNMMFFQKIKVFMYYIVIIKKTPDIRP